MRGVVNEAIADSLQDGAADAWSRHRDRLRSALEAIEAARTSGEAQSRGATPDGATPVESTSALEDEEADGSVRFIASTVVMPDENTGRDEKPATT